MSSDKKKRKLNDKKKINIRIKKKKPKFALNYYSNYESTYTDNLSNDFDKKCSIFKYSLNDISLNFSKLLITTKYHLYIPTYSALVTKPDIYNKDKIYLNMTNILLYRGRKLLVDNKSLNKFSLEIKEDLIRKKEIIDVDSNLRITILMLNRRININDKNLEWVTFFDFYNLYNKTCSVYKAIMDDTCALSNTHIDKDIQLYNENRNIGKISYRQFYNQFLKN